MVKRNVTFIKLLQLNDRLVKFFTSWLDNIDVQLLFHFLEVIYVDRYIHIYMHNLAESRISSVPLYSSNIDVEFVGSIENEEFSATSGR